MLHKQFLESKLLNVKWQSMVVPLLLIVQTMEFLLEMHSRTKSQRVNNLFPTVVLAGIIKMHLQKIVLVYCVKMRGQCFFMPHYFGQRLLTLTFGRLLSVYLMTFAIYNLVRTETATLTVYHYLMLIHPLRIIIPLAVQLWYLMIASQLLETVYQNGSNAVGLVHTWETQNTTPPVYLLFSI